MTYFLESKYWEPSCDTELLAEGFKYVVRCNNRLEDRFGMTDKVYDRMYFTDKTEAEEFAKTVGFKDIGIEDNFGFVQTLEGN